MNLGGQRWCSGVAIENSDYLLLLSLGAGRTRSDIVFRVKCPGGGGGHMCLNTGPPAGSAASGCCGTFRT